MNRSAFALACAFVFFLPRLPAQDAAQPPLPTITLRAGDKKITAEVADEPAERMTGLMFRKSLATDSGMLFVMPRAEHVSFWMKNTLVPLSIAYINPKGTIMEIHDLEPQSLKPVGSVFGNILYALEMERDWFANKGILPGTQITGLPSPKGE